MVGACYYGGEVENLCRKGGGEHLMENARFPFYHRDKKVGRAMAAKKNQCLACMDRPTQSSRDDLIRMSF